MAKPRVKNDKHTPTVYHVGNRVVRQQFEFGDEEKEYFLEVLEKLSKTYFVRIIEYKVMDNHYHLEIEIYVPEDVSDEEIKERFRNYYGDTRKYDPSQKQELIERWGDLSKFMQDFQQRIAREMNRKARKKGHFWQGRFFSTIVEGEEAVQTCAAYISLNDVRAGIVENPKDYPYGGIGEEKAEHGHRLIDKEAVVKYTGFNSYEEYVNFVMDILRDEKKRSKYLRRIPQITESLVIGPESYVRDEIVTKRLGIKHPRKISKYPLDTSLYCY